MAYYYIRLFELACISIYIYLIFPCNSRVMNQLKAISNIFFTHYLIELPKNADFSVHFRIKNAKINMQTTC